MARCAIFSSLDREVEDRNASANSSRHDGTSMRLLLISNSGRPFLEHCREQIAAFLSPIRSLAYMTAARLEDEDGQYNRAVDALNPVGITVEHLRLSEDAPKRLGETSAIFVGGGNTYALLSRLRAARILSILRRRVRAGLPYVGTSAGANICGPNILATNDWNVVGTSRFDALGLVPWTINPHYLETDPAMAPTSETRDERIREYLQVNANPVIGIEENTALRIENGRATVRGAGRAKLFCRGQPPRWFAPGQEVPFAHEPG
jgi:dipeptidase E